MKRTASPTPRPSSFKSPRLDDDAHALDDDFVVATQLEEELRQIIQEEEDDEEDSLDDEERRKLSIRASEAEDERDLREWVLQVCIPAILKKYPRWKKLESILEWYHTQMMIYGSRFYRDGSSDEAHFVLLKRAVMKVNGHLETWKSQSCGEVLAETTTIEVEGKKYNVGLHVLMLAGNAAMNRHIAATIERRSATNDHSRLTFDEITIPANDGHDFVVYSHLSPTEGPIIGMTEDYGTRTERYFKTKYCSRKVRRAQAKAAFAHWKHGVIHVGNTMIALWALFGIESSYIFMTDSVNFGLNTNYVDCARWPNILSKKDVEAFWQAAHDWLRDDCSRRLPCSDTTRNDDNVREIAKLAGITKEVSPITLRKIFMGLTWRGVTTTLWRKSPFKASDYLSGAIPYAWKTAQEKEDIQDLREKADPIPRNGGKVKVAKARQERKASRAPPPRFKGMSGIKWEGAAEELAEARVKEEEEA